MHCNVLILGEKKLLIDPEIDVNLNENKRNYESATTSRHARLSNKKQRASTLQNAFIADYLPVNIWTSTVADVELMIEHA